MAAINFTQGKFESFLDNGQPNNGGSLEVFVADGAFTTYKTHYAEAALTTPNANPKVLDSAGRTSSYFEGDADVRVKDSAGNTIYTVRNINPSVLAEIISITSNTTLTALHNQAIIEVSGTDITLSLTSAATLTKGWSCEIKVIGTSTVILARLNVADTIDTVAANINLPAKSFCKLIVNYAETGFDLLTDHTGTVQHNGYETFNDHLEYVKGYGLSHYHNLSFTYSLNAGALTFSIINKAGNTPSATDPAEISFHSGTTYVVRKITSALTFTISSGSTFGAPISGDIRVWIVLFDDNGTLRLGAINCLSLTSAVYANIYSLKDNVLASSTAEGGAGGADSAGVIYTGTAVTSKPMRVLGYIQGTIPGPQIWVSSYTKVLWSPSFPLPGQSVGHKIAVYSDVATGTTILPRDDTIPVTTEGDQYMTITYAPSELANVMKVTALGNYASSTASAQLAQFIDVGGASAVSVTITARHAAAGGSCQILTYYAQVSLGASQTFNVRAGDQAAGTVTFNGTAAARLYGGKMISYIEVIEYMA